MEHSLELSFFHSCLTVSGGVGLSTWNGVESLPSAVCGVIVNISGQHRLLGTAFFIAPGIAVSARHIFSDYIRDDRLVECDMRLIGEIEGGSFQEWRVVSINSGPRSDVALLLPDIVN
jgi:hypothetical protein